MSIEDFWQSTDIEVHAYEKAYFNRINQQTWLQGFYNYQAQASVLSGVFAKKKSDILEYPKQPAGRLEMHDDSISEHRELSEEEKDKKFRDILMEYY